MLYQIFSIQQSEAFSNRLMNAEDKLDKIHIDDVSNVVFSDWGDGKPAISIAADSAGVLRSFVYQPSDGQLNVYNHSTKSWEAVYMPRKRIPVVSGNSWTKDITITVVNGDTNFWNIRDRFYYSSITGSTPEFKLYKYDGTQLGHAGTGGYFTCDINGATMKFEVGGPSAQNPNSVRITYGGNYFTVWSFGRVSTSV